ncbi:type I-E CRISPR-associated protein Cas6/Cse3/CasE [Sulfobacillus thermosulfidooxidans]|uniref:type I-E CRISPR-associated protein Cas6/Cse3/CasE n=1 Tax=Sulfobacillus thermosulfidooxidans TaxID=28034 RepID=UPI0003028751|nr:type I-E CRISPR-associated protein Cas6/Cse3/CasE [Sulfobacillus thermosulfidooxidans]
MNPYLVEMRIDPVALFRFATIQGWQLNEGHLNYIVHAWLSAAFDTEAPKPWRLFWDGLRPPRILGYTNVDAQNLYARLMEFSDPGVTEVIKERQNIMSRPVPIFKVGRHLHFAVQCIPVVRYAKSGVEKDLYLHELEKQGTPRRRDEVYSEWVTKQLTATDSVTVLSVQTAGFRLTRQVRRSTSIPQKDNHNPSKRKERYITRPEVVAEGELVITDSEKFPFLLRRGVGRHRGFGYGMILLRPPS